MGLLSARLKLFARTLNDSVLNRDMKNAKNKSYRDTGKLLQQAKQKGDYINGSKLYRDNLNRNVSYAKRKHCNHDKFISDL